MICELFMKSKKNSKKLGTQFFLFEVSLNQHKYLHITNSILVVRNYDNPHEVGDLTKADEKIPTA
jgi:hypothetical protein